MVLLAAVFAASLLLPGNASGRERSRYLRFLQDSLVSARDSLPARDTVGAADSIHPPDSAELRRIADSTRLQNLRDSADRIFWGEIDTSTLPCFDSLVKAYYNAQDSLLPDTSDIKRALRRIRKEERDSLKAAKPRVLETFILPDSLYFKRIVVWTSDKMFNELHETGRDTTADSNFDDYPFFKKSINASYLGTVGSATLYHDWFKREEVDDAPMFSPYIGDSYTDDNIPMFNTKTPYTELGYSGTLLSNKTKEESNLKLLSTQNITPEFNFTLAYRRLGSRGMLKNEATDHRTTTITGSYMGKRYFANFGTIRQRVERQENGGIQDIFWIRDTSIDAKAIDVNLASASNTYKRRSWFIHQTLAVPMNFFRKDKDSLSVGEGTMALLGHSGEYTTYNKLYVDEIDGSDSYGRDFYFNRFYIDETKSSDELAVRNFENRVFLKLQPFAPDAILAKVNAGAGYQILSTYSFTPNNYLTGHKYKTQHNIYIYGGASGQLKKYIAWNADADYYLAGYRMFDFDINGNIRLSVYPIDQGIHLSGKFHTGLRAPHPFEQHIYTNHHRWDNEFSKVSTTTAEAELSIPKWRLDASFRYALVAGMLYYDTESVIRQHSGPISIMSASLQKNFTLWRFHFDNRALFQLCSNTEVLTLPKVSLNLRYYVDLDVVKDVLNIQIGLNGYASSRWYIPSYSPDTGQFFNQTEQKSGLVPYFDAFVNAQWKMASLFIKYTNCFQDWPSSDYFSAFHYIRPQSGVKLGILWPFYVQ